MSLKRVSIMWIDGKPETARRVRGRWHSVWLELCWVFHPVNRWNGLTSDNRDPIDIARQMDEFMRVRRIRY